MAEIQLKSKDSPETYENAASSRTALNGGSASGKNKVCSFNKLGIKLQDVVSSSDKLESLTN